MLKQIISYLTQQTGVRTSTTRPQNAPTTLITVVRTGGEGTRFVDRPQITTHCWAKSDLEAYELADAVARAMLEAPDYIPNLARVEQGSIYQNPYSDGTPRWSVNYILVVNR